MRNKAIMWLIMAASLSLPTSVMAGDTPQVSESIKATIYIYRESGFVGKNNGNRIFLDDQEVGEIKEGTYIKFDVPAGKHTITSVVTSRITNFGGFGNKDLKEALVRDNSPFCTIEIDKESGSSTYIWQDFGFGKCYLKPVDANKGQAEVAKNEPVKYSDNYNPQ